MKSFDFGIFFNLIYCFYILSMFHIEDYDYDLPEELIAQAPAPERDGSRLLVLERSRKSLSDHHFFDLPWLLRSGDVLVVNNTRVVPARLYGLKNSGGQVELLVLEHSDEGSPRSNTRWCLLKASKRPKRGTRLFFDNNAEGVVKDLGEDGLVKVAFESDLPIDLLLEKKGVMPLPPYIKREKDDQRSGMDRERYQTVFSRRKGAVAAPTAGLHFTPRLMENLSRSGVVVVELTLHVGHGTFKPVRVKDIRNHSLGREEYIISRQTASDISKAKEERRRVIAVGTTVVRTLETAARGGRLVYGKGRTELLITPGFEFKVVDGMITNFHLPRSSLLFLVSAFAGLELIRTAYRWAVAKAYRFYSYGDAMLIL
jgi:S-adenosylmethionine:tRNA ribosyltransferase-isomerase